MFGRFGRSLKAAQELGIRQSSRYSLYQFGLLTGHYRRSLDAISAKAGDPGKFSPIFSPAQPELLTTILQDQRDIILTEADRILSGQYRPFGGEHAPLDLSFPNPDLDWTEWHYPTTQEQNDIKDIWEPNRFGWAVSLARAYQLSGDDRYAEYFWQKVADFAKLNPYWKGPNWESGQEVGLRLIHWAACASIFLPSPSSDPERLVGLARQIQMHALRIPVTLVYAKAQNNNHWLSEAAAMFTAGMVLPDHPLAAKWKNLGWQEFETALLQQIADDGTYIQQSVCYHRLMLTLALWMDAIRGDRQFSPAVRQTLGLAARWLNDLIVGKNGEAPNLGSNDGSLILPFGNQSVFSHREVTDAALKAFCFEQPETESEFLAWFTKPLGSILPDGNKKIPPYSFQRLDSRTSVGFLRTAVFNSRPSHADQLHFDLWWDGENILKDAGTYRYTASSPWDNALASTGLHNTVMVNGKDQMTRVGKFLWADWAQADAGESLRIGAGWRGITASHDGYRKLGITHQRTVEWNHFDTWVVRDAMTTTSSQKRSHQLRLHWLLPDAIPGKLGEGNDWLWSMAGNSIVLTRGEKVVAVHFSVQPEAVPFEINLYRAGETLFGSQVAQPTWGWFSPTYGLKLPSLSVTLQVSSKLPVTLITEIQLTYSPLSLMGQE